MPVLCPVFNSLHCAAQRKTSLTTVFSQLLKIMVKRIKTFESEKVKVAKLKFSGNI